MIAAAQPLNESERLKELLSFEILDTEPENQFEEIVKLAAHICGTPISLITLIDDHRQWFKAKVGLDVPETSRDVSFCSHVINENQDEVFVVNNATTDTRFYDNPLVTGSPHIQFYAGYPLKTANGLKLGSLCVIDTVQKELTAEQKIALELLAKQVIKELELRKAYRDLAQRNQMLHGILDNIPVIAYRLNADGLVKEALGSGLKPLGFKNNQEAEQSAERLFPDLNETIQKALKSGSKTFTNQTQNQGKERSFEHYIFPDQTNPGGVVGFALDITSRKRIEQELRDAKEKAERATLAKSSFLANMSHEIRTPIHAILGFAEVLKKQEQSPQSVEYLNYITSSGELLLKLIGDVLDLTKIEEGKLEIHEEPFHLTEVLKSNLHPYQFRAQEKGLNFELAFAENLPAYVIGDAGKISQIIINLIGNALKFTQEGEIQVHVSLDKASGAEPSDWLRVEVTDSGIGIPKEKQEQIFKSFTQADTSINRKFGGSGLGLSIVKELVARMNGELGVESPVYQAGGEAGSRFWFTVPIVVADTVAQPDEIQPTSKHQIDYQGKVQVLLVDDNELNQRLASIMLQNMGCRVSVAGNGQEAIELIENNSYGLILMDIQMPVLNGYEATKWIRNKMNITVPVIGLSANVYKEEIELCFASGMNDYLGKPYTEKSLQEKIAKWVPFPDTMKEELKTEHSSANVKLTDLTFLNELFGGDKESITEMVHTFINQQKDFIAQMEESLSSKNYLKLAMLAHNMRSSIQTVGLEALREPLINLETLAKDNNATAVHELFKIIKAINQKAINELKPGQQV